MTVITESRAPERLLTTRRHQSPSAARDGRNGHPSILVTVAALALLAGLPSPSAAQGKITIAIWEFDNNAATYWFSKDLGPAARNQIDTQFSENSMLSSRFSVIERDKLDLVLKEQNLAGSGAVDPSTAAKVGKLLGAKYIVLGGVDKFTINNTKGNLGAFGVGGSLVQANATINLRFIDTTTAERVVSLSADGEVKKGGGMLKGTSLSRNDEWGIASDAIQKASKSVVAKLMGGDYMTRISTAATPTGGLEGKIIKVEGDRAFINLGATSGIKVGDAFNVISVGEALIDPDTGKKLGAEEKEIGSGSVVEVQPQFAIMTFTGKASAKDTIRKK
jgi:curli biogenesis system outer membrane secretion channel CsgG